MQVFLLSQETEQGETVFFIHQHDGNNGRTVSSARSAKAAWSIAEAKALKCPGNAEYTTCPQSVIADIFPDDPRSRAAWVVK